MTRAQDWLDEIELIHGDPLGVMADCVRGTICAAPGRVLNCADFSSVEARSLAWQCGEQHMLDAYHAGEDVYCLNAEAIFGYPVHKDTHPAERNIGKVAELAFGYQGAVGAWQTMARSYGIDRTEAEINAFKVKWRENRPATVDYWHDLNRAAMAAVTDPGASYSAGAEGRKVFFKVNGSFLLCALPSKRRLVYPFPRVEEVEAPWSRTARREWQKAYEAFTNYDELLDDGPPPPDPGDKPEKQMMTALTYMTRDSSTGYQWRRATTYGGKLAENVTQAICRDLLAEAMTRLDANGFNIVMHVHDEVVSEDETDRLAEMIELMTVVPSWAEGMPVAAEGWTGKRFRK